MATIEEFAAPQGWKINSWTVSGTGTIPSDGLLVGSTLLIAITVGQPETCDLIWLNAEGILSSIGNVPFLGGELQTSSIPVNFGGLIVDCSVNATLDTEGLTCILRESTTDGNTGTFVADANPPLVDEPQQQTQAEELVAARG